MNPMIARPDRRLHLSSETDPRERSEVIYLLIETVDERCYIPYSNSMLVPQLQGPIKLCKPTRVEKICNATVGRKYGKWSSELAQAHHSATKRGPWTGNEVNHPEWRMSGSG
jgi:hypothetical protein